MRAGLRDVLPWLLLALATAAEAQDAQALRARHAALRGELADNPFGRPLHVESSENGSEHKGAVYAVLEQPFSRVATALRGPAQWCEVLILQANIKDCEASDRRGAEALSIFVARNP